ncbi:transposase [Parabacteroides sp. FAFU027]|uniref:transposase n=1 Tax=Parabacteroides sp. FAFU027 TaxID=2922715 RepID=UPI001FAF99AB|nr:transposase [Parabacteroides sp. FAFU027]
MGNDKFMNKYRIPSARAAWHDYNGGFYFITICTAGRKCYFGHIEHEKMILNVLGQKLSDKIRDLTNHHPYAVVTVDQIMPNHLHLIVCIDEMMQTNQPTDWGDTNGIDAAVDAAGHVSTENPETPAIKNEKMQAIADQCGLLSTAMGGMKSSLTRFATDNKIAFGWQTRFHDHIIRDEEEYCRIEQYIRNNPATWKDDKFYSGE